MKSLVQALLEILAVIVVVALVAGLIWLFVQDIDTVNAEWEASESRRWEENGRRMSRCESVGGIPILDRSQWMTRCDFPPQPCSQQSVEAK